MFICILHKFGPRVIYFSLPPFSLENKTHGNVSKISVSLACSRQIGSKSTNHSHLCDLLTFFTSFFFFFFCILYIFIDWKLHTFFSQTNIVHINRQTRYIIYLHTHPTVPLNSNLLLNIIQVQRSNNARFYIHLIVFILAPFHIMSF